MGVDFNRQRTGKRGLDGNNVARTATPRWLSLAVDSQLDRADRHQHVALSIVSAVKEIRPLKAMLTLTFPPFSRRAR